MKKSGSAARASNFNKPLVFKYALFVFWLGIIISIYLKLFYKKNWGLILMGYFGISADTKSSRTFLRRKYLSNYRQSKISFRDYFYVLTNYKRLYINKEWM